MTIAWHLPDTMIYRRSQLDVTAGDDKQIWNQEKAAFIWPPHSTLVMSGAIGPAKTTRMCALYATDDKSRKTAHACPAFSY
jgi:hypothetical protein